MFAGRAARENWGNGSNTVCVACILAPSGKPTRIPFVVEILSVGSVGA